MDEGAAMTGLSTASAPPPHDHPFPTPHPRRGSVSAPCAHLGARAFCGLAAAEAAAEVEVVEVGGAMTGLRWAAAARRARRAAASTASLPA